MEDASKLFKGRRGRKKVGDSGDQERLYSEIGRLKIYPYLLRGLAIGLPNHAWSRDITDVRLAHGFA